MPRSLSLSASHAPLTRPWLPSLLLASGLAATAQAQTPPDAGRLLQQQNETRRHLPPPERSAPLPEPAVAVPVAGTTRVTVRRFVFEGNTRLDSTRLQLEVQDAVDRTLSLQELRALAARIVRLHAREGWVVRCELPAQDLTEGTLRLQVIEARFGGVRMEGEARHASDADRARRLVVAQQPVGEALYLPALERGLMLAADLPGLGASGSLQPGEREGETLLALQLRPAPALSGDVGADNAGARSTGTTQVNTTLQSHGGLGFGERLNATLNHSQGSDFANLGASLPVGDDGWRAGVQASSLRYRLVGDEFSALGARGSSRTWGLTASYPVLRARDRNLQLRLLAERRRFDNRREGLTVSRYQSLRHSIALDGGRFDAEGGGVTTLNVALDTGRLDLSGSPTAADDANTARTAGRFTKLRYGLGRQQPLATGWWASAQVVGQWADRNLDSSEKFYLGGAYGVRAYPSSEAGGSRGVVATLELRTTVAERGQLGLFYDWGQTQAFAATGFTGAPARNTTVLRGVGLSGSWRGPGQALLQASAARRVGSNPNASATGQDQDGSRHRTRLWLQATLPF